MDSDGRDLVIGVKGIGRDDSGFSLSELIIVLGLLGVVLAGAFAFSQVAQKSAEAAEMQSAFATDIARPLEIIEVYAQQNNGLEAWDNNRIVFFTDRNLDGLAERVTIEALSDGQLRFLVWKTNAARVNQTQEFNWILSERNSNVAAGVPLFRYFNLSSQEITNTEDRASATRSIRVQVVAEVNDRQIEDDKVIMFRNRN